MRTSPVASSVATTRIAIAHAEPAIRARVRSGLGSAFTASAMTTALSPLKTTLIRMMAIRSDNSLNCIPIDILNWGRVGLPWLHSSFQVGQCFPRATYLSEVYRLFGQYRRIGRMAFNAANIAEPLLMSAVAPGLTSPAGMDRSNANVFNPAMIA